jgi:hypothetical protein
MKRITIDQLTEEWRRLIKIVLLHRQGEGLTGPSAQHESERGISPHLIDARITNADTPAQVAKTILDFFVNI